jgi:hypothetical protein
MYRSNPSLNFPVGDKSGNCGGRYISFTYYAVLFVSKVNVFYEFMIISIYSNDMYYRNY